MYVLNPFAFAVKSYIPTGRLTRRYAPVPVVTVSNRAFVPVFTISNATFGTAEPVLSTITPVTAPRSPCAIKEQAVTVRRIILLRQCVHSIARSPLFEPELWVGVIISTLRRTGEGNRDANISG